MIGRTGWSGSLKSNAFFDSSPVSIATRMSLFPYLCGVLVAGATTLAHAENPGWEERLAQAFSGRLKEIQRDLALLPAELNGLPDVPIADQGGTGGFASIHPRAVPDSSAPSAVEIRWLKGNAMIDQVALVPARRYNAKGLDPHFGMPDRFTVELIDSDGNPLRLLADERDTRSHPARKGHPFVYQISPPVEAAGLRITATLLVRDSEEEGGYVHAWAEVFALAGERNVAYGGKVHSLGGTAPPSPWHWNAAFLVDEQTPLGLPETPTPEHLNVGWLSNGRSDTRESASLTLDLGEESMVDAVRLLPARRPTSDLPSGFGFPQEFEIAISNNGKPGDAGEWKILAAGKIRNPGHNPVWMRFEPARGRYLKIEATRLWKAFESYPAFFALSEVEVLTGADNLALRKPVRSPDGMLNMIAPGGRYWSSAALSDGYGPDGKLVPIGEWMTLLDKRLHLETRRHQLQIEAARVVAGWRNTGLVVFALLGLAGAFASIALPIRYRLRATRELMQVRERIAGDLHDEVGSNLGSIQMFADLAEGRAGPSDELKRIQRIAAETVSAVRDIVWLLRPGRVHRIGTVEHLRETSSIMLESLKWKFSANEDSWLIELPEEDNRHLFLFFREALHNIMRHARASHVDVHVESNDTHFVLSISDDGVGIDPAKLDHPATLRALRQRAEALSAELRVESTPGDGSALHLKLPLGRKRRRKPLPPAPVTEG